MAGQISRVAPHVAALPKSGIRKFFDIVAQAKGVVSLGVGEPDFDTPWHISRAAVTCLEDGGTHYTSNLGTPALRQAIDRYLSRRFDAHFDWQREILVTVGVSEALDLAIRALCAPGDEVLYHEPCFVSYAPTIRLAHAVPVCVETHVEDEFRLTVAALEKKVTPKTKAVLLNFPCNPTGATLNRDEMGAILEFAKRHDLIVLADEVYSELNYEMTAGEQQQGTDAGCGDTSPLTSFASFPEHRDRVVLLNGFSKSWAMTGYRLGYACGPADIIDAMMKIHQYGIMSAPTLSQAAGVEAMDHGDMDVDRMRREYRKRRDFLVPALNGLGLKTVMPKGAFYIFSDIRPTGLSDEAFALKLLKGFGVAVVPGSAFGASGAGFVRMSYATSLEKIKLAVERIRTMLAKNMRKVLSVFLVALALGARGDVDFNAGADLRIREELIKNVPGLPGGGHLLAQPRSGFANHIRFRPRVWGELKGETENWGRWRVYTRLTDEFRWCPEPKKHVHTFPDELIVDNLFVEGKGLFDGFLDVKIGRQDFYGLYGLDHVFVDGTPGDGSRTTYGDLAGLTFNFTEQSKLDLFALYNFDDCDVRWGTERSRHTHLTSVDPSAEPDMDDWGFGAIWSSKLSSWLPYKLFAIQKNTQKFKDRAGKMHPWTQRELVGAKLMPQLNEEWSLQLEGMGQVGVNGDHDTLMGWSAYSGVNWKSAVESSARPFGKLGYHFMSGDDDAAEEDGGHSAWDPMWARGVNDSEMFLYGTHYGAAWWSNMHYVKLTLGLEFGRRHRLESSCGPLWAAAQDHLGGGDSRFKGFLSQVRYDFPIWLADKKKGERFEVFGHLLAEFFNPGDYYATDRPGLFFRWQVDFTF